MSINMSIHLLDKNTIDQIAAGEVVERPLNVVKELVENSIDAGSGFITVETKKGGIDFIRVTDDGCGIPPSEVPLAFLRHSTSKISDISDLNTLNTLGFRGEALSSICAVSKTEMITTRRGDITGTRILWEGGEQVLTEEVGAPEGTTIIVRDIFYNVPARRKFLKSASTEGNYISDMLEHLALGNPNLGFKYIQNGKLVFHTTGNGNVADIISRIYGRDTAGALIPIDASGICRVTGFLGSPEIVRSGRSHELYFANGRFIKSKIVDRAIEEGYRGYLMQHRFPFCALFFEMDPCTIDVNIHPSKMDIRIQEEQEFYDFLSAAIADTLKASMTIRHVPTAGKTQDEDVTTAPSAVPEPFERAKRQLFLEEARTFTPSGVASPTIEEVFSEAVHSEAVHSEAVPSGAVSYDSGEKPSSARTYTVNSPSQLSIFDPSNIELKQNGVISTGSLASDLLTHSVKMSGFKIIGQAFDTYWIVEYQDKLLYIDQHAAHEKVRYERLLKQYREHAVHTQLLEPAIVVELTAPEADILERYTETFNKLGFGMEEFGERTVLLREVPAELYGMDEKQMFLDTIDDLLENKLHSRSGTEGIFEKIASMACKSAVKGNMPLSDMECRALIEELLSLENPYNCPHGRPTMISVSKSDMEKRFKRIL